MNPLFPGLLGRMSYATPVYHTEDARYSLLVGLGAAGVYERYLGRGFAFELSAGLDVVHGPLGQAGLVYYPVEGVEVRLKVDLLSGWELGWTAAY
jgi:hypothetical protein